MGIKYDFVFDLRYALNTGTMDVSAIDIEFTGSLSQLDSIVPRGEEEMAIELTEADQPDVCQQVYYAKKIPKQLKTFEMKENAQERCIISVH